MSNSQQDSATSPSNSPTRVVGDVELSIRNSNNNWLYLPPVFLNNTFPAYQQHHPAANSSPSQIKKQQPHETRSKEQEEHAREAALLSSISERERLDHLLSNENKLQQEKLFDVKQHQQQSHEISFSDSLLKIRDARRVERSTMQIAAARELDIKRSSLDRAIEEAKQEERQSVLKEFQSVHSRELQERSFEAARNAIFVSNNNKTTDDENSFFSDEEKQIINLARSEERRKAKYDVAMAQEVNSRMQTQQRIALEHERRMRDFVAVPKNDQLLEEVRTEKDFLLKRRSQSASRERENRVSEEGNLTSKNERLHQASAHAAATALVVSPSRALLLQTSTVNGTPRFVFSFSDNNKNRNSTISEIKSTQSNANEVVSAIPYREDLPNNKDDDSYYADQYNNPLTRPIFNFQVPNLNEPIYVPPAATLIAQQQQQEQQRQKDLRLLMSMKKQHEEMNKHVHNYNSPILRPGLVSPPSAIQSTSTMDSHHEDKTEHEKSIPTEQTAMKNSNPRQEHAEEDEEAQEIELSPLQVRQEGENQVSEERRRLDAAAVRADECLHEVEELLQLSMKEEERLKFAASHFSPLFRKPKQDNEDDKASEADELDGDDTKLQTQKQQRPAVVIPASPPPKFHAVRSSAATSILLPPPHAIPAITITTTSALLQPLQQEIEADGFNPDDCDSPQEIGEQHKVDGAVAATLTTEEKSDDSIQLDNSDNQVMSQMKPDNNNQNTEEESPSPAKPVSTTSTSTSTVQVTVELHEQEVQTEDMETEKSKPDEPTTTESIQEPQQQEQQKVSLSHHPLHHEPDEKLISAAQKFEDCISRVENLLVTALSPSELEQTTKNEKKQLFHARPPVSRVAATALTPSPKMQREMPAQAEATTDTFASPHQLQNQTSQNRQRTNLFVESSVSPSRGQPLYNNSTSSPLKQPIVTVTKTFEEQQQLNLDNNDMKNKKLSAAEEFASSTPSTQSRSASPAITPSAKVVSKNDNKWIVVVGVVILVVLALVSFVGFQKYFGFIPSSSPEKNHQVITEIPSNYTKQEEEIIVHQAEKVEEKQKDEAEVLENMKQETPIEEQNVDFVPEIIISADESGETSDVNQEEDSNISDSPSSKKKAPPFTLSSLFIGVVIFSVISAVGAKVYLVLSRKNKNGDSSKSINDSALSVLIDEQRRRAEEHKLRRRLQEEQFSEVERSTLEATLRAAGDRRRLQAQEDSEEERKRIEKAEFTLQQQEQKLKTPEKEKQRSLVRKENPSSVSPSPPPPIHHQEQKHSSRGKKQSKKNANDDDEDEDGETSSTGTLNPHEQQLQLSTKKENEATSSSSPQNSGKSPEPHDDDHHHHHHQLTNSEGAKIEVKLTAVDDFLASLDLQNNENDATTVNLTEKFEQENEISVAPTIITSDNWRRITPRCPAELDQAEGFAREANVLQRQFELTNLRNQFLSSNKLITTTQLLKEMERDSLQENGGAKSAQERADEFSNFMSGLKIMRLRPWRPLNNNQNDGHEGEGTESEQQQQQQQIQHKKFLEKEMQDYNLIRDVFLNNNNNTVADLDRRRLIESFCGRQEEAEENDDDEYEEISASSSDDDDDDDDVNNDDPLEGDAKAITKNAQKPKKEKDVKLRKKIKNNNVQVNRITSKEERINPSSLPGLWLLEESPRWRVESRTLLLDPITTKITKIDVSGCKLTGKGLNLEILPSCLQWLDVSSNRLSGEISLANLPPRLTHLYLYSNEFSGSVDLTKLPSTLMHLYLYQNRFSGGINLKHLPDSLEDVNLSVNHFSGAVDVSALPTSLKRLALDNNLFTGSLELATDSLQFHQNLLRISLHTNCFKGSLNLTRLPKNLTHFEAHSNQFSELVDEFGSTNATKVIVINEEGKGGYYASSANALEKSSLLVSLSVALLPRNLTRFTLHRNKISARLGDLSFIPPSMSVFDISDNDFGGEIIGLENLPLPDSNNNNNKINNKKQEESEHNPKPHLGISILNLSFNNFVGRIPDGVRVKSAEELISRLPTSLKCLDLRGQQQQQQKQRSQNEANVNYYNSSRSGSAFSGTPNNRSKSAVLELLSLTPTNEDNNNNNNQRGKSETDQRQSDEAAPVLLTPPICFDVSELMSFAEQYPSLVLTTEKEKAAAAGSNNNYYSYSTPVSTSQANSRTPSKMHYYY